MSARVLVIIPTHNHPTTLELAARSVLEQSETDLELVIIGDGTGDDTRDVVAGLRAADERVAFVDRAKGKRHNEPVRDEVIRGSSAPLVAYCGDDDLLLPHHLAAMRDALADRDFVHPLAVYVGACEAGDARWQLHYGPTDLSKRAWVRGHQPPLNINVISLTGVVHTRASYLRLPYGWRTTPSGYKTDHFMWQQYFSQPWFRGVTAPVSTTIKLGANLRVGDSPERRGEEIQQWWDAMHTAGFVPRWDAAVAREVAGARFRARAVYAAAVACDRLGATGSRRAEALVDAARGALPRLRTLPPGTEPQPRRAPA